MFKFSFYIVFILSEFFNDSIGFIYQIFFFIVFDLHRINFLWHIFHFILELKFEGLHLFFKLSVLILSFFTFFF